jgi:hypothetical protein|tara:strand:- start:3790 stop:4776 length:987 start_codon:yes stop_codon:yes gene_type:complete
LFNEGALSLFNLYGNFPYLPKHYGGVNMPRKSNNLFALRYSPEFEFLTQKSESQVQAILSDNHFKWTAGQDDSLQGVGHAEICPDKDNHLSGSSGYLEVENVIALVKEQCNATQSPKTGFHIHWNLLDDDGVGLMTPKQLTNVFIDWFNFKRVIELILPESRAGDNQTNLWGISRNKLADMRQFAESAGENSHAELGRFILAFGTKSCSDIRISEEHKTLEFRKAIFTVDSVKLSLWIEFTRNLIGYNMKARQKNFRKVWNSPDDRVSTLTRDKGLAWSFRQVWEYRAGNLGLMKIAEKRALQLARNCSATRDQIQGITDRIKTRYNR